MISSQSVRLLSLLLMALVISPPAFGQQCPVHQVVKIAQTGDMTGIGENTFAHVGVPFINDVSQVAFWGQHLDDADGLWLWTPSISPPLHVVSFEGDSAAGTTFTFVDYSQDANLNNLGELVWHCNISINHGIWKGTPATRGTGHTKVVFEGDDAPDENGQSLGVTFNAVPWGSFGSPPYPLQRIPFNDRGDVVFKAQIDPDIMGYWLWEANPPLFRNLIREGYELPDPPYGPLATSIVDSLPTHCELNADGEVAYTFTVDIGGEPNSAVVCGHPPNPPLVVKTDDPFPNAGPFAQVIGGPFLTNGGPGTPPTPIVGLYHTVGTMEIGFSVSLFTRNGSGAWLAESITSTPGLALEPIADSRIYPSVNRSRVAIFPMYRDHLPTNNDDTGIYIWRDTTQGFALTAFALEGTPIPCVDTLYPGANWGDVLQNTSLQQAINENNQIVILTPMRDSGPERGLLYAADLRYNRRYSVIAVGDPVTGFGVVEHIILGHGSETNLPPVRDNPNSSQKLINNCGEIVFGLRGTTTPSGSFIWRMPHPADLNRDCMVNVNDFVLFQGAFAAASVCAADYSGDGALNVNDFILFQQAAAQPFPCN